jgi:hypothetical protein
MMDVNLRKDAEIKNRIKSKIWIDPEMYASDPFITLSASALRTLLRCLQKRKWERKRGKIVYVNEGFTFPYTEAARLKIGTTQHWKNMRQLVELGFIDVVHQGGWYQKHEREKDYSVYRLSDRWKQYGTKEFERIEKAKALPPDFYVRANMDRKKTRATSQKRRGQLHDSEDDRPNPDGRRLHDSEAGPKRTKTRRGLVSAG